MLVNISLAIVCGLVGTKYSQLSILKIKNDRSGCDI